MLRRALICSTILGLSIVFSSEAAAAVQFVGAKKGLSFGASESGKVNTDFSCPLPGCKTPAEYCSGLGYTLTPSCPGGQEKVGIEYCSENSAYQRWLCQCPSGQVLSGGTAY